MKSKASSGIVTVRLPPPGCGRTCHTAGRVPIAHCAWVSGGQIGPVRVTVRHALRDRTGRTARHCGEASASEITGKTNDKVDFLLRGGPSWWRSSLRLTWYSAHGQYTASTRPAHGQRTASTHHGGVPARVRLPRQRTHNHRPVCGSVPIERPPSTKPRELVTPP